MKNQFLLILVCCLVALCTIETRAQTTAFTYQGRLVDNNGAANGSYSMQFRLYDDSMNGNQIGTTQTSLVTVNNGIFTTKLDFGSAAFASSGERWLEIQVGSTTLAPRQEITPTPKAIHSLQADTATNALQLGGVDANQYVLTSDSRLTNARTPTGTAGGDLTGSFPNPTIAANAVTAAKIATGNVVKSINNLKDSVTLSGSSSITVTPSGNTLTLSTASPLLRKFAIGFDLVQPSNVTLTHGLNTTDVQIVLYKFSNNIWEMVPYGNTTLVGRALDANTVQVAVFSSGTFRIVIIG